MTDLTQQRCIPCEGGVPPLTDERTQTLLQELDEWELSDDKKIIFKEFAFKDYYKTMAFVNAIAWSAHQDNHHPDLTVSYGICRVSYTTHAIHGLSENDFICAAKVDALMK